MNEHINIPRSAEACASVEPVKAGLACKNRTDEAQPRPNVGVLHVIPMKI